MHGVLIAAIVVGGIIVITVVAALLVRAHGRGGVRRAELARVRLRLRRAEETLRAVEAHVDKWNDIDSVLATDVRVELRRYRDEDTTEEGRRTR